LALDSASAVLVEPIKAHVDGFGVALFDSVINDAGSTTVVNLEGCRWLWMAHLVQDDTEGNALLAGIEETGAQFGFSGGSQDNVKDGAEDMDGAVHGWWSRGGTWGLAGISGVAAEIEVATCSAVCFWLGEVRGVTVDLEAHVACIEANGGLGVGGAVV
jgi:hypothetical protein